MLVSCSERDSSFIAYTTLRETSTLDNSRIFFHYKYRHQFVTMFSNRTIYVRNIIKKMKDVWSASDDKNIVVIKAGKREQSPHLCKKYHFSNILVENYKIKKINHTLSVSSVSNSFEKNEQCDSTISCGRFYSQLLLWKGREVGGKSDSTNNFLRIL